MRLKCEQCGKTCYLYHNGYSEPICPYGGSAKWIRVEEDEIISDSNSVNAIWRMQNRFSDIKDKSYCDQEKQKAYALGAYEVVLYMYHLAEEVDDADGLKQMIRDEYKNAKSKLHKAIMEGEE